MSTSDVPAAPPVTLPARFLPEAGVEGFLDQFGPARIQGWIARLADPAPHITIDLSVAGQVIGQVVADIWRVDVQETRQGDGRWGFNARPPACLADGAAHDVTLTLPGGAALLPGPVRAGFTTGADTAAEQPPEDPRPALRPRLAPLAPLPPGRPLVSFIVVFYNMSREAPRTLTSLSRAYQIGAAGIDYEVICIDNGSQARLSSDWVASFGPEFRLFEPSHIHPSPVAAMNEAARQARGHHVALMIDGAHLLSPGVLREAADAIAESPGAVVGLRQWFIGGDQRFLARSGWTRAQEDMLFSRADWPRDGYEIFAVSAPAWESPNHWFDGMSESNCLFVPADVFTRIGGFDEAFDEGGAGYANLDLFRRAVDASAESLIALIGEASFHQFHDGTTTNVHDDEKERRVRLYEHKYVHLRERLWESVPPAEIRLRGQIHRMAALVSRQRPLSPAQIGVTNDIRPAVLPVHFDAMAADYLISVYAEARLHEHATWRGGVLGVAPPDAFAMASILHEIRPARVIAVNLPAGLLAFLQHAAQGHADFTRFVIVGEGGLGGADLHDPRDPALLGQVRRAVGTASETMVIYRPRPGDEATLDTMHTYAGFVSLRSYLVCVGSAIGQPWLGYARSWTMNAITQFTRQAPFAIDTSRTAHFITSCPNGFLQRIGPVASAESNTDIGLVGVS